MGSKLFAERLRGAIAGYFFSFAGGMLWVASADIQKLSDPRIRGFLLLYIATIGSVAILAGLIGYWVFCQKPFAALLSIVFMTVMAVAFFIGSTGVGLGKGPNFHTGRFLVGHVSSLMIIGASVWLWKRDNKEGAKSGSRGAV